MAYHAVRFSVIYIYACKYWRCKLSADKTWKKFKTFFTLEYNDFYQQQRLNVAQLEFHNDNHAFEEQLNYAYVLDNLSLVDSSDKDVFAKLIAANKILIKSNKALMAQFLNQDNSI